MVLLASLSGCAKPTANTFSPPEKTNWVLSGIRMAGTYNYDIIAKDTAFKTMHGNINNTDNLWIAAAPMFALDWVAEESMYVPEGPTYDRQGNLYFSPLNPTENEQRHCSQYRLWLCSPGPTTHAGSWNGTAR